jgi:hypothetical protein
MKAMLLKASLVTVLVGTPSFANTDYVTGEGTGMSALPYEEFLCRSIDYHTAMDLAWKSADLDAESKCRKLRYSFARREAEESSRTSCEIRRVPFGDPYGVAKAVVSARYLCAFY